MVISPLTPIPYMRGRLEQVQISHWHCTDLRSRLSTPNSITISANLVFISSILDVLFTLASIKSASPTVSLLVASSPQFRVSLCACIGWGRCGNYGMMSDLRDLHLDLGQRSQTVRVVGWFVMSDISRAVEGRKGPVRM